VDLLEKVSSDLDVDKKVNSSEGSGNERRLKRVQI